MFVENYVLESLDEEWLVGQGLRPREPVYQWNGGPFNLSDHRVPPPQMQCSGTYIIEAKLMEEGELTAEAEAALCSLAFPEDNRFVGATGVRDCGKVRHGILYRPFLYISPTALTSQNSGCVDVRCRTRTPLLHISTSTSP